tara:strand:+ start:1792 stop:2352 length:561 start_codon:yes stop_codon:yes gene_type:complete
MKQFEKFINDITEEARSKELNKNAITPIMDRIQLHIDMYTPSKTIGDYINPNVAKDDRMAMSLVYEMVYPSKKIQKIGVEIDGEMLPEEKVAKHSGIALLKKLGINVLKNHPKWGKYVFKTKEEFYKSYSNNVTLLEMEGSYVSVLHILYSTGNDTLDKLNRFSKSINEYLKYEKIKVYDNSYYEL